MGLHVARINLKTVQHIGLLTAAALSACTTGCERTPRVDSSAGASVHAGQVDSMNAVEIARQSAIAFATERKFPQAEIERVRSEPPLIQDQIELKDGLTGQRIGWLGNGKGGGWWVQVVVSAKGEVEPYGGFAPD